MGAGDAGVQVVDDRIRGGFLVSGAVPVVDVRAVAVTAKRRAGRVAGGAGGREFVVRIVDGIVPLEADDVLVLQRGQEDVRGPDPGLGMRGGHAQIARDAGIHLERHPPVRVGEPNPPRAPRLRDAHPFGGDAVEGHHDHDVERIGRRRRRVIDRFGGVSGLRVGRRVRHVRFVGVRDVVGDVGRHVGIRHAGRVGLRIGGTAENDQRGDEEETHRREGYPKSAPRGSVIDPGCRRVQSTRTYAEPARSRVISR